MAKRQFTPLQELRLKQLGQRIKALRQQRFPGVSYETFAFDKGLNRVSYWRMEQGQDPRFSSLVKVCQALGVTLQEFFAEGFAESGGSK